MRLQYVYQDAFFDDLRDVVNNNKLEINYGHLFEEYLPFQVFITGETAFKGVRVSPSVKFEAGNMGRSFSADLLDEAIADYLTGTNYHLCSHTVAAVSGGVDSSVVALHCRPDKIYSGYYPVDGYSEIEYSKLVAQELDVEHLQIKLDEEDFLEGLEDYMDVVCTPVAGMGGVMELVTLQKALKNDSKIDSVLFGNGGDEIFLGYFFNHFVKELYASGRTPPEYMPNFLPMKANIINQMLDTMIVASINRLGSAQLQSKMAYGLLKELGTIRNVFDKLLYININMTLPSLLHVNQQICNVAGVNGFNPLTSPLLIENASRINMPADSLPKHKLREVKPNLPEKIKNNTEKRGFPIPLSKWEYVDKYFEELWEAFKYRDWYINIPEEYPGLNRLSWGIANIELFLRRYA